MSNGPSTASSANLQTFLDTFVCQANTNGTGYFYFEVRRGSVYNCSILILAMYSSSMKSGRYEHHYEQM